MPVRVLSSGIFCAVFFSTLTAQKAGSVKMIHDESKTINACDYSENSSLKSLPFLICSPESLRIYSPEGAAVKLSVTSNRNWILYCYEKWIFTDSESGGGFNEVIINAVENPESFERIAKIVIKADGLPDKIVILSQKARHDE